MDRIETLPDWSHIEQLRKHLWCDREFGKAAVMVGTGFSRNANRILPGTAPVPLWGELAKRMYDLLYPPESPPEECRKEELLKATSGVDALKLASECEAYFGRQALDKLIEEAIPDNSYSPGELHELLLSLPWSDVFTTNYDTLLEKARPAIHDRKYDVVLTPLDLPGKMKPRIVKLHGSFPSHRPFIITEEDYRTYPVKFAPFVNMVQQSMLENAFCLIGFSGDDPNFLHWVGWVRDNLGPNAPSIYLCGILDLAPPRRRVLEDIGVIPIDLSPLFPESDWIDPELRHAEASKQFLSELMRGKPPNVMNWQIHSSERIWKSVEPPTQHLQAEDLKKICSEWCQDRLDYPGWVIAPKKNRDSLWMCTERWIKPLLHSIEELPPPENLFLLYELNWRLETALIPLFMTWVEKSTPVIETFNPYPKLFKIEGATIVPDKDEYKRWDWKSIGECWVGLAFALAREARENQDEKRFRLWIDRLEEVAKQRTEWHARWSYEECLFYLFRFDQEKIRETLENWPETSDLPFWEVKHASILAELGELKEAERIAEGALSRIRSQIQPYSIDYSLVSQEGWTMLLLKAIKDDKSVLSVIKRNKSDDTKKEKELEDQYRDRWDKLETYRYNPYNEIELLASVVNWKRPSYIPPFREISNKGFDPGTTIVRSEVSPSRPISEFLPSFAFLRMFEEGAVPTKWYPNAVVNAAKWIVPYTPLWSFSSMIRAGPRVMVEVGEEGGIWEFFDRVRIATLTLDEVDYFNQICVNSLTRAIRHLEGDPQQINSSEMSFSRNQVEIQSEFLSRLCFRFSIEQLDQLFDLTVDMYRLPIFRQDWSLRGCVNALFKRLLLAMPQSEILQRIPELLSLPIPTEMGFKVDIPPPWHEPFKYIVWLEDKKLDVDFDRSADWSTPIANLIRVVKEGAPEARIRASERLSKIHEIDGGLTDKESDAFGEALWSKTDPDTGLPSNTGAYKSVFLHLPEPKEGGVKEKFRNYLLSMDSPNIQEWLDGTVPLFSQNEEEEQKFVDWTRGEVTQLLKKADTWRNEENTAVQLMANVILPRLADADEETKALAGRLLSNMEQSGFCVLSALPTTLFIDPKSYDKIAQKLRHGLGSTKEEEVHGSTLGIFHWIVHASKGNISHPPNDLLNKLVDGVFSHRQPGLDSAIRYVSEIIRRLPGCLDESQMESLFIALKYLIKETELPERRDTESISDLPTPITVNERLEYRKLAAELAYRIFNQFTSKKKEIPQILTDWEEICKKDPLPEVKKVWR